MLSKKLRSIVTDVAMEEFLVETAAWRDSGSMTASELRPISKSDRALVRKRLLKRVRQRVATEIEVDSIISSILVGLALRFAIKLIETWMDEL